jgi:hypothetical protein
MPVAIYVYWDNPWLSPVNAGDPDPRTFNGLGATTVNTGPSATPPDWQIGVIASEIQVSFTCASARTVEILLYEADPGGDVLIAGNTFPVAAGSHTVSLPIATQTYDLVGYTFSFGGPEEAGDSLDGTVVIAGSPPVSDFWTDFVKSYEVP